MTERELACLIGWPVSHSASPAIHNAAFQAEGLPWTYLALPVRPGGAGEGVELLRALGVVGANVTTPHKAAVVPRLDAVTEEAERIRAVNTVVREKSRLIGHNTDGAGFVSWLAEAGIEVAGARAVVLGAGGAARSVALALSAAGATVVVSARDPAAADEAARIATAATAPWGTAPGADLLVQATSARVGLPLQALPFAPEQVAVDLIYGPEPTPFLRAASAAGARWFDGLGMLIHQAALSFQLWTGIEAPLDVMRAAAEDVLGIPPEATA